MYRIELKSARGGGGSVWAADVGDDGRVTSWVGRKVAGVFSRDVAEAKAQRLAEFVAAFPSGGVAVARRVRVVPVTGGLTHWRPTV